MYAQDLELPPGGLYNCLSPLSDGRPQSTFEHSSQPFQVDVRDLREFHTHEDRAKAGFHLDSCAFEIFQGFGDDKTKTALEVGQYRDAQYITGEYYQDVVKLLEKRLQTEGFEIEVAILGHRVRLRATDNDKPSMSQPTKFCHIDQTATEGLMLVEEIFGSEAAGKVRPGRNGDKCMIVNVWRVLADNPANDWPLGMIDARTLDTKDLILGHLYPNGPWPPGGSFAVTDRTSSLYGVKHRETQEWWYLGQQKVEEAILMLIWVSSERADRWS